MKFNHIIYIALFGMHGLHAMQKDYQLTHRNASRAEFVMQEARDMYYEVQPCYETKAQQKDFFAEFSTFKTGACIAWTGQLLHCCSSKPILREIAVQALCGCCDCSVSGEECDRFMTAVPWGLQLFGLLVAGSSYKRMQEIRKTMCFGSGMILE